MCKLHKLLRLIETKRDSEELFKGLEEMGEQMARWQVEFVVLKSKGDAFWKQCSELSVTELIAAVSITSKSYLQALKYVVVAMLGQENEWKIPILYP